MAGMTRRVVMSPIPMTIQLSIPASSFLLAVATRICNIVIAVVAVGGTPAGQPPEPALSLPKGRRRYKTKGRLNAGLQSGDRISNYFFGAIASLSASASPTFTPVLALLGIGSS